MNPDGSIRVVNRGYEARTGKWKEAVGKAKFVGSSDEARLKVSFFGPFYGGYNVIALDPEYTYALVAGDNLKYLWILSRKTTIPEATRQAYLKLADELGFNTEQLIWVEHSSKSE
jgi:apolipoprotein D and lipocalin family protein